MKADFLRRMIARMYARAFLQATPHFDEAAFERCHDLEKFIRTHDHLFFFIPLQSLSREAKQEILVRLAERFELGKLMEPLIGLLTQHKRLFLLAEVCEAIVREYAERHNRVSCRLMSTVELTQKQQKSIIEYIEQVTGKTIDYETHINEALIAGVRVQADIFLFEHSIAQQLKVYNGNQVY